MADRGDLPKIRLNESQYLQVIYSPALRIKISAHVRRVYTIPHLNFMSLRGLNSERELIECDCTKKTPHTAFRFSRGEWNSAEFI